ncbi:MAG TPA: YceI family protein [Cyclobacteriaceae bacterium]|nr:YceI family protein [Cyclobacteriaceae bacterium]
MKIYRDGEVINWTIDRLQSEFSFKVRHLMISHVKGKFKGFNASVSTTGQDFSTADINLNIESETIDTGDAKRDSHLRSADFLYTDKHKQITFTSTSISRTGTSDKMELRGNLTIVGITKNIKLDMQMGPVAIDSLGNETACFMITGKITREDWRLRWTTAMEASGFLIGDEVIISCKLEFNSMGQHDAKPEPEPVVMRIATF